MASKKDNIEEVMHYGDVVGVIGGKISKEFTNADKFMVVSAAPAVVGSYAFLSRRRKKIMKKSLS